MNYQQLIDQIKDKLRTNMFISIEGLKIRTGKNPGYSLFSDELIIPEVFDEKNKAVVLKELGHFIYALKSSTLNKFQELNTSYISALKQVSDLNELQFMVPCYNKTKIITKKEFEKMCGENQLTFLNDNILYKLSSAVIMFDTADTTYQSIYQKFDYLNGFCAFTETIMEAFGYWFCKETIGLSTVEDISATSKETIQRYNELLNIEDAFGIIGVVLYHGLDVYDFDNAAVHLATHLSTKTENKIVLLIDRNFDEHHSLLLIVSGNIGGNSQSGFAGEKYDLTILDQNTFMKLKSFCDPNINDFILDGRPLLKKLSFEEMKEEYLSIPLSKDAEQYLSMKSRSLFFEAERLHLESKGFQNNIVLQISSGLRSFSFLIDSLVHFCFKERINASNKKITTREIFSKPTFESDHLTLKLKKTILDLKENNNLFSNNILSAFLEDSRIIIFKNKGA